MASESTSNRIDEALRHKPPGLWPFLAAAHPDLHATEEILRRLCDVPIRGAEIGFPFSDPIADGPVIQSAFTRALSAGVKVDDVFSTVARVRAAIAYPIVAMVSASIVYRVGMKKFVDRSAEAGFDGLIVPDLSLEEATGLAAAIRDAGLRLCMLVAPSTPPERRRRIAEAASGFLYYVSVQGVTGERRSMPQDLAQQVTAIRASTGLPVLVGFGISTAEHVRDVCRVAAGAIVGSAIVRKITDSIEKGHSREAIVAEAVTLVRDLAGRAGE